MHTHIPIADINVIISSLYIVLVYTTRSGLRFAMEPNEKFLRDPFKSIFFERARVCFSKYKITLFKSEYGKKRPY